MNIKKISVAFIVLILDQISKYLICINDLSIPVIDDFFYIDYISNTGAAFSILSGHNIILILLTLVIGVFVYHLMYSYKDNIYNSIAFGILFGGIFGNLLDRLFIGYVRDFLSFRIGNHFFPTFNIADTAIVIGVILIIISTIREEKQNGNKSKRSKRKKTR